MKYFWKGKKVLITGHTGFKGIWLSLVLNELGSSVAGYSLKPRKVDNFYKKIRNKEIFRLESFGDINDKKKVTNIFKKFKPDIVFHLAAQPLVIESLKNPYYTYQSNVMGTLNILEMTKNFKTKASIFITTDKCYENIESKKGYKETDIIGGKDIYSSSKACCEILIKSYRETFSKNNHLLPIVSVRAGNVLGGGDFNENRIIPDYFKAYFKKKTLIIRNPNSIRPWQYILDVVNGYLLVAERTFKNKEVFFDSWNFGPNKNKLINVEKLINIINNEDVKIKKSNRLSRIESKILILNSNRAKKELNWKPKFSINRILLETKNWYKQYYIDKSSIHDFSRNQIINFFN